VRKYIRLHRHDIMYVCMHVLRVNTCMCEGMHAYDHTCTQYHEHVCICMSADKVHGLAHYVYIVGHEPCRSLNILRPISHMCEMHQSSLNVPVFREVRCVSPSRLIPGGWSWPIVNVSYGGSVLARLALGSLGGAEWVLKVLSRIKRRGPFMTGH